MQISSFLCNPFPYLWLSGRTVTPIARNQYMEVSDPDTVLAASNLHHAAAIAIVSDTKRMLLHIDQADVAQCLSKLGNRFFLQNPCCAALLEHLASTLTLDPGAKVTIVLGAESRKDKAGFIGSGYFGRQPVRTLVAAVGADRVGFYRSDCLELRPDGSIVGLHQKIPL